jgi:putative transposase
MAIRNELIEELLTGKDPQDVFAQDGLLDELKKALAERILNAEMDQHLADERSEAGGAEPRNHRKGHKDCAHRRRQAGAAGAARPAGEL